MRNFTYIFPAAGKGERFVKVGELTPKPLINVFNVPLILYALFNFPITQKDEVFIVSQKSHELPKNLKFAKLDEKLNIRFIELEDFTAGPAETVFYALKNADLKRPIIIANTDQYVFVGMENFMNRMKNSSHSGVIMSMEATSNKWSYIKRNSLNFVSEIREKVQISNEATVGIYGFKNGYKVLDCFNKMFENNDKVGNEFYVAPSYNYLIKENEKIECVNVGKIESEVRGTGTPEDLEQFANDSRVKKIAEDINKVMLVN